MGRGDHAPLGMHRWGEIHPTADGKLWFKEENSLSTENPECADSQWELYPVAIHHHCKLLLSSTAPFPSLCLC